MSLRWMLVVALLTAALCSGCGLFQPQKVPLEPAKVAAWTERLGPLEDNRPAWCSEASKDLGEEVLTVEREKDGAVVAVLGSPAAAVGKAFVSSFVTAVAKNPTESGILAALGAAGLLALQAARRRWGLPRARGQPPPTPPPEPAPAGAPA